LFDLAQTFAKLFALRYLLELTLIIILHCLVFKDQS